MSRLLIRALALVTILVSPLAAQKYRWEEISDLGIRIRIHEKLKQVPMQLGTKSEHLRAKFEPGGESDYIWGAKGRFPWELQIYEFTDYRKATTQSGTKKKPQTPAERKAQAIIDKQLAERIYNFEQWIGVKPGHITERTVLVEGKKTKAKGKKPGYTWWEFLDRTSMSVGQKSFLQPWYMTAAVYKVGPSKEIGLVMGIPLKRGKRPPADHRKWAKTMLRSLTFMDIDDIASATDNEKNDLWAKTEDQKKALDAAKANIADLDHWDYFTSPNYIVLYSWPKPNKRKDSRKFATKVAKLMEGIREQYVAYYPPHNKITTGYSVLRICARYDDFQKYGQTPFGVIGWFSSASKELVIFDDATDERGGRDLTIKVAFHEGWHQYADAYFPKAKLHRWFDEGLGDFFGCFEKKGKRWVYIPAQGRIQSIVQQLREKDHIPLEKIVSWERRKFYGNRAADHYAQGYSLVDFLIRGKERGVYGKRWNENWSKILPRYTKSMLKTKDQKKAVTAAFAGVDYTNLEENWKTWVRKHIKKKGL